MDYTVFLLLISRLPLYAFVFYKAWQFRKSVIVISSLWLGLLAVSAIITAFTTTFAATPIRNIVAYSVAISMFMLALTARELKN